VAAATIHRRRPVAACTNVRHRIRHPNYSCRCPGKRPPQRPPPPPQPQPRARTAAVPRPRPRPNHRRRRHRRRSYSHSACGATSCGVGVGGGGGAGGGPLRRPRRSPRPGSSVRCNSWTSRGKTDPYRRSTIHRLRPFLRRPLRNPSGRVFWPHLYEQTKYVKRKL